MTASSLSLTASTTPSTAAQDARALRAAELRAAWDAAREASPHARALDVAQAHGASELELVAARIGQDVTRLRPDWGVLLPALADLGPVMGLTRNPHAVIEKHGTWGPFSRPDPAAPVGLVLDEGLDLRLFLGPWAHVLAVVTPTPRGLRRSLQFFDAHGLALHKVFVMEDAGPAGTANFDALVLRLQADDQSPFATVTAPTTPAPERPDSDIDVAGFQAAWLALQDTHDFFGMLRRFGVSRTQALRLAPPGHAYPVPTTATQVTLEHAAAVSLPIMVFVGNRGCIEIHTGPVSKVKVMGPWLNVLDPSFNLHLRQDRVASAFVVTKPTVDGPVTSLELFDAAGENIALLFGKRKPGLPEDPAWRAFAHTLPAADAA